MIRIRRATDRGHANTGWLETRHTFSFAAYMDPEHMQFSVLRVLNQDRILPGRGFPAHGHRDMEIVSYVLEGTLEHRDSMGHGSQIRAGEVQVMSAGTGVTHSEFNASSTEPVHFLQMWVLPAQAGTTPRYEQRDFGGRGEGLRLVVSPDGRDGSLTIGQDASMLAGVLPAGTEGRHELAAGRVAWLHVGRGRVALNGEELAAGDGAAITAEPALELLSAAAADVVIWDLPAMP